MSKWKIKIYKHNDKIDQVSTTDDRQTNNIKSYKNEINDVFKQIN